MRIQIFGRESLLLATAMCVFVAGCSASSNEGETTTEENPYFVSGLAAADPDFPGLTNLCAAPVPRPQRTASEREARPAPKGPPATRVFDNLIFLGHERVSAWAVETSEGLILIDALAAPSDAETFIEGGLESLGLSAADIKIMLISHGHGDHYAGGRYLQEKYGMQVVMSEVDWEPLSRGDTTFNNPSWAGNIPTPDRLITTRDTIELGDTTLELVPSPGHTMGTITTIISVKDGDNSHLAALWGGTGFNFEPNTWQFLSYAASADRMRDEVLERGIEVFLSNHVRRDQSDKRIERLQQRDAGAAHPFVLSPERLANGMQVFRDCALGRAVDQL